MRTRSWRRGMTVVELLLVMLIGLMVAGVGLSLYRLSYRYYARQDALLEQNQNLRTAMSALVRDLRQAGNGLYLPEEGLRNFHIYLPTERGGWFRHSKTSRNYGVRPIYGLDGGLSGEGSDRLTLMWTSPESREPLGRLAEAFKPGGGRQNFVLRLEEPAMKNSPALEERLLPGDVLALVHNGQGLILEAGQVDGRRISLGQRFRPLTPLPLPDFQVFPPGARLYNLRDLNLVTYYIDASRRRLMVDNHQASAGRRHTVLAVDIEDLQIRFFLDGETVSPELGRDQISENELDGREGLRPRRIQALNLALVSRSSARFGRREEFRPQAVYNHQPQGGPDGRERRVLTETVSLRSPEPLP